ncbi:MAG: GNAT family N-acetyltransferase [Bacteroidota bacterium]|nr:GNAT family N-acetyltransferase [Bacteroidota bacterium]
MTYLPETERLRFREMRPEDAEAMFHLNSDPEVVQYTGDGPFESVEAAKDFLTTYQDVYKTNGYARWIVELKSTGEILGWCGLKLHPDKSTDVGYRFYKKHWGKGYATESAKASIDYGFSVLKLQRIFAHARKENIASLRVLEKCGLKIIGEDVDCDGEIFVWEILKA